MNNPKRAYYTMIAFMITLLLLSTATVAWFTLSTKVDVNNISMSVTTPSNIYVADGNISKSNLGDEDWSQSLDMDNASMRVSGRLTLSSSATGFDDEFYYVEQADENGQPAGDFVKVHGENVFISADTTDTTIGYYANIPLWFKAVAGGGGEGSEVELKLDLEESTIVTVDNKSSAEGLAEAVRLSFLDSEGKRSALDNDEPLIFAHDKYSNTKMFDGPVEAEASYNSVSKTWTPNPFASHITPIEDDTVILKVTETPTLYMLRVWVEGQDMAAIYDSIKSGATVDDDKLQIEIGLSFVR